MRLKEFKDKSIFLEKIDNLAKEWIDEFNTLLARGKLQEGDWDNYFQNKLREEYGD